MSLDPTTYTVFDHAQLGHLDIGTACSDPFYRKAAGQIKVVARDSSRAWRDAEKRIAAIKAGRNGVGGRACAPAVAKDREAGGQVVD